MTSNILYDLTECYQKKNKVENDYCKDLIRLFYLAHMNYGKNNSYYKIHIDQSDQLYYNHGTQMKSIINKYKNIKDNYCVNSAQLLVNIETGEKIK